MMNSLRHTVLRLTARRIRLKNGDIRFTVWKRTAMSSAVGKSNELLRWQLCSAVCLRRPPILTTDYNELEKKYLDLLAQEEFEKSVLSNWEVEKRRQNDLIKAVEMGEKSIEEMDFKLTYQDREDEYEVKFKNFQPADKDLENDSSSPYKEDIMDLNRKMKQSLTYVVNKRLGKDNVWMLPVASYMEGETMRECAERALSLHCQNNFSGRILSKAPSGYFKYKFPKEVRLKSDNDYVGAKVFIYTALLQDSDSHPQELKSEGECSENDIISYAWVTDDELAKYLKPKYLAAVKTLLL